MNTRDALLLLLGSGAEADSFTDEQCTALARSGYTTAEFLKAATREALEAAGCNSAQTNYLLKKASEAAAARGSGGGSGGAGADAGERGFSETATGPGTLEDRNSLVASAHALEEGAVLLWYPRPGIADLIAVAERAAEQAAELVLKRHRESDSVSISGVGTMAWGKIQHAAEIECESRELPDEPGTYSPFEWKKDVPENKHSKEYMQHLGDLIKLSSSADRCLVWLECGDKNRTLLNIDDDSRSLHYRAIHGTTDVAIVTRASVKSLTPADGLCILIELKKSVEPEDVCQAKCQLLLANMRSPRLRPVTVLTDLRESWQLMWLEGKLLVTATGNPCSAIKTIQGLVGQYEAWRLENGDSLPKASLPCNIAERTRLQLRGSGGGGMVDAGIDDLEGMLDEREFREACVAESFERLLRTPQLWYLRQYMSSSVPQHRSSNDPPPSMYS